MKALTCFKSGIGLIYTSIILAALYFGVVWLTQYVVLLNWTGAILFWLFGLPIVIGLFQAVASVLAFPVVYLLKGAKWMCWLLLLPMLYFSYSFGHFLWMIASAAEGILVWLLAISWFMEIGWLFVAYFMIAMGSAYEEE